MKINESAENYLETILVIKNKKGNVRSIDIAKELCISKPSVSVAMKHLREKEYITVNNDGDIELTAEGQKEALRVYERHNIIAKALILLGVDEDTAFEDSCKIEHDISDASFEKLKEFIEKNEN